MVIICTSSRTAEAMALATVFGMSWNLRSRNTEAPVARILRTMSGPAAVNSSLPILNAPTAGATCCARVMACSAVGTSSATIIGFCIGASEAARRQSVKQESAKAKGAGGIHQRLALIMECSRLRRLHVLDLRVLLEEIDDLLVEQLGPNLGDAFLLLHRLR